MSHKKSKIILLVIVFGHTDSRGQIILRERMIGNCCTRYSIINRSTDSLYILSYGLRPKYEDSCIVNMVDVDSGKHTINIHSSRTHDDFFETELPYWIYLYPNDSTSFNIRNCNNLNYTKTFEIYLRALMIKNGKRRKSPYPSRRVYKMKAGYRKFAVE